MCNVCVMIEQVWAIWQAMVTITVTMTDADIMTQDRKWCKYWTHGPVPKNRIWKQRKKEKKRLRL